MTATAGPARGNPQPFGDYAAVYDLLYHDKDYGAEAAFIAGLLARFLRGRGRHVLDLACGTGRHAVELARLGCDVEGSDLSAAMLESARRRAEASGVALRLHHESFQTCNAIGRQFDAVLALFASLGYLVASEDLDLALRNVATLLAPGGVFVFDVWNGTAVVRDYSPHKVKRARGNGIAVERISRTKVDEARQVADVHFEFVVTAADGAVSRFEEHHRVRFFFPEALEARLQAAGYTVLLRCPFLEPDRALQPGDWNMTYVVRSAPR